MVDGPALRTVVDCKLNERILFEAAKKPCVEFSDAVNTATVHQCLRSRFSLHGVQTPASLGLCRKLAAGVVPDR